jgi:hypothetical protein
MQRLKKRKIACSRNDYTDYAGADSEITDFFSKNLNFTLTALSFRWKIDTNVKIVPNFTLLKE